MLAYRSGRIESGRSAIIVTMRNAFADEITELADRDERIVLLSGDIGNRLFDRFKAAHPQRFFNCGVAEQNMIGMAAGLAMDGFLPVVYTIASFLIYRPYEQIRVDVAYHDLPVTLVGVGGGLSYAANGGTHHSLEDIAVMRCLPGMRVVCPGDAWEVRAAVRALPGCNGPLYLRIGKKNEPLVHMGVPQDFQLGTALKIRPGQDAAILATGNQLPCAVAAADRLAKEGFEVAVYSMHTVKPLDEALIDQLFSKYAHLFSIEEHSVMGGLGSALLECGNTAGHDTRKLHRIAIPDAFIHETGGQAHARGLCGLSPEAVAEKILKVLS